MDAKSVLLQRVDLASVMAHLLPEWSEGHNVSCPFAAERHDDGEDKSPSMSVGGKGQAYCHACGYKASSFVGLYEDLKGVTYEQACRELWNASVEPLVPDKVWQLAHKRLLKSPDILASLLKRRGVNRQTVKKYKLGWYRERLSIPVFNGVGYCVNVRRYDLLRKGKAGAKVLSYAKGFGAPRIFPRKALVSEQVVLLEGEMDTLLALQCGLPAATVTGGAITWKDEWSAQFNGHDVVIVPDNDSAGKLGASKKASSLRRAGASVRIVELPVKRVGEDFTDWVLKYKGNRTKLEKLMQREISGAKKAKDDGDEDWETRSPVTEDLLVDNMSPQEVLLITRAGMVFEQLSTDGAFFRDPSGTLYYATRKGHTFHVNNSSSEFMAHLARISPLVNSANTTGRFVVQHVINHAFLSAKRTMAGTWSYYTPSAIYVKGPAATIWKANGQGVERLQNAVNESRVLLEVPDPSMGFTYHSTVIGRGLQLMRRNLLNNIAAGEEDRYLILCWLVGIFFREWVRPRPLLRLLARTAWGKSTATRLISYLMLGDELLNHSATTIAASYEMAWRHPILLYDNIETKNMTPAFEDFMLIAATGGAKVKRQYGKTTGVQTEQTNCLLMTNGIEPFNKHELINRHLQVDLDLGAHGRDGFNEAREVSRLKQSRDILLSTLLDIAHLHVLPNLTPDKTRQITKELGHHSKERFNDYLSMMVIALEAVWQFIPLKGYDSPMELARAWVSSQGTSAEEQDAETNDVLYFLETYVSRRHLLTDSYLKVKETSDAVIFKCATHELLTEFRVLARQFGLKCPWNNARQLGTRLADADDILRAADWVREIKVLSGRKVHKFTYRKQGHGKETQIRQVGGAGMPSVQEVHHATGEGASREVALRRMRRNDQGQGDAARRPRVKRRVKGKKTP